MANHRVPIIETASATIWGDTYSFEVYPLGAVLPAKPGIYLFTELYFDGDMKRYRVRYVGQASKNFRERVISGHQAWEYAHQLGFDHVLTMVVSNQERRNAIECTLWYFYKPPCNEIAPPGCS